MQSVSPSMLEGIIESNVGTGFLSSNIPGLTGGLLGGLDLSPIMGSPASQEDCLFLDLVVPGKAIKGQVNLPVINWIYGGEL
jgi:hypothetical protein